MEIFDGSSDSSARITRTQLAVLVAGVSSMGLEILAGRIIAPEFGSSIYTWGSIIGVFLTALSLGYYRGGKRAKEASRSRLAVILLFAASYVALVVLFGDILLELSTRVPLPPRFSALTPVVLLFGPPVYMLGFISPYAAELSVKESTGESAGQVYAIGTIGSIIGAFATTFFLIPWLSVET
ncbi:MAG: fused MFS/spermidine synthase, partial [Halobacteria archaeon]|nr:fused MFS/spermidine synthase [Halobacteria archaeon]